MTRRRKPTPADDPLPLRDAIEELILRCPDPAARRFLRHAAQRVREMRAEPAIDVLLPPVTTNNPATEPTPRKEATHGR